MTMWVRARAWFLAVNKSLNCNCNARSAINHSIVNRSTVGDTAKR